MRSSAVEHLVHTEGVTGSIPVASTNLPRYCNIVNDANRYANETVGDPAYPLKRFQRVTTVSLETIKIVRGLQPLDIMEPKATVEGSRPLEPTH